MAYLWKSHIQFVVIFFVLFAQLSSVATQRYGFSIRTNPYNELLQEKVIKQAFMKKLLDKLGMAKRPPPIPYDKRKPNIPRPVIDGGISAASEEEDAEKKVQIVIASEEENRANCQDKKGCYSFKLNHSFLRRYSIQYAALHIHNEAQSSADAGGVQQIVKIDEIDSMRKRRSTDDGIKTIDFKSLKSVEKATKKPTKNGDAKKSFDSVISGAFDKYLYSHWLRPDAKEGKKDGTEEEHPGFEKESTIISAAIGAGEDKTNDIEDVVTNDVKEKSEGRRRKPRQVPENTDVKESSDTEVYKSWKRRAYIPQSGWFNIKVHDIIDRWVAQTQGRAVIHRLRFTSDGLTINTKPRFRPFIVLKIIETKPLKRRKKRSYAATCVPGFEKCCLRKLYVKFKDLNWHDWIIEPDGYQVNYCEGRCTGTGIMAAYSHAYIKTQLLSSKKKKDLKICCIPLKFDNLPLLHYDEGRSIHKTVLEGMSVLECGCV